MTVLTVNYISQGCNGKAGSLKALGGHAAPPTAPPTLWEHYTIIQPCHFGMRFRLPGYSIIG